MKRFMAKLVVFIIVVIVGTEIFCRILIDPIYFYRIDTYNIKKSSESKKEKLVNCFSMKITEHVDFLFIGSSRVPATINPQIFMQKDPSKIAVAAGRGYTTVGIHYQALKNRISAYPNYLKNANVFIEYSGSKQYDKPFTEEQLRVYEPVVPTDKAMPHFLLPYLDYKLLLEYVKKSPNSWQVKREMILLFFSSAYRSVSFIKEQLQKLDTPILKESEMLITSDGGIKNDKILLSREKAITVAKIQTEESENSQVITMENLNKSALAYLNSIIKENGGKLFLYKLPLHSIQKEIYNSDKEKLNQKIFEEWLNINSIEIIYNNKFDYNDSDFPDTWHLRKDRRDEFSLLLYKEFKSKLD